MLCLDTISQPSHLPGVHCHEGMVCQRGGGEHIYIYIDIVYDVLYALYDTLYVSRMIYGMLHVKYDDIDMLHIIYICESVYIYICQA